VEEASGEGKQRWVRLMSLVCVWRHNIAAVVFIVCRGDGKGAEWLWDETPKHMVSICGKLIVRPSVQPTHASRSVFKRNVIKNEKIQKEE
jgi:hypothetical protein